MTAHGVVTVPIQSLPHRRKLSAFTRMRGLRMGSPFMRVSAMRPNPDSKWDAGEFAKTRRRLICVGIVLRTVLRSASCAA